MKELEEGQLENEYPILGILLVDFFNFYNSFELLEYEIHPLKPTETINRMIVMRKEKPETFLHVRGKICLFFVNCVRSTCLE